MEVISPGGQLHDRRLHVPTSVTCSVSLDARRETVPFLSALMHAERRRGIRRGRRALGCSVQAILIPCRFTDLPQAHPC